MHRAALLDKELKILRAEEQEFEKQTSLKALMAKRTEIKWEKVSVDEENGYESNKAFNDY